MTSARNPFVVILAKARIHRLQALLHMVTFKAGQLRHFTMAE
jgi:hypothetical protein